MFVRRRDLARSVAISVATLIKSEAETGFYAGHAFTQFVGNVADIRGRLHELVAEFGGDGRSIAAFGSSVGCAAIMQFFELSAHVDYVFDDTPLQRAMVSASGDIPILPGSRLAEVKPALTVILAWRYADPIMSRHADYIQAGGRFAVALPTVKLI